MPLTDEGETLREAAKPQRYWTNSSASLLSAIQNSVGIAVLPTYFSEGIGGIVPLDLDPGLRTRLCVWLAYHPNVKGAARVRVVMSLFGHDAYPCFRDEFHPPKPAAPKSGPPMRPAEVPL